MNRLETELITRIEELQAELNEQARLLGMSAERELKLIAEIERLRAEITTREDGAERMALKGIEMRAEIQRLINERNAFGLAIDRAISGIVPDEHPLRSRLVEIAALKARLVEYMQQEPAAWRTFDGEGGYDYCSFADNEALRDEFIKRNGEKYASWVEPLYLSPGTQENNDE